MFNNAFNLIYLIVVLLATPVQYKDIKKFVTYSSCASSTGRTEFGVLFHQYRNPTSDVGVVLFTSTL
jgi:hypothetical protein